MERAREAVHRLAAPLAAAEGVDLLDVQVKGSGPRTIVRVVVDRQGGVDLARCQRLSQGLSEQLDATDPLPDRYALEVTSPGTDYPLRDQPAFRRVEGRPVLVHRRAAGGAVLQVRGTVRAAEPEAVVLDSDGAAERIDYDDIIKATQSLPW